MEISAEYLLNNIEAMYKMIVLDEKSMEEVPLSDSHFHGSSSFKYPKGTSLIIMAELTSFFSKHGLLGFGVAKGLVVSVF